MDANNEQFFQKLEEEQLLISDPSSLGWAFWPFTHDGKTTGYFDEHTLRMLADEIERRNKPFWDQYEQYCKDLDARGPEPDVDEFTFLTDEQVASQSASYARYSESVKNSS